MKKGTRTALGIYLQSCLFRQLPFVMQEKTTLNESLNIQAGVAPPSNVYPTVKCIGIGVGGLRPQVSEGLWSIEAADHEADHFGFYKQMPFVIRRPENDLSPTERAKYALRRIETINNISYVAYYLRRLDNPITTASLEVLTVNSGVTTSVPFVPTTANLNPTVPDISNKNINTVDGTYITASNTNTIVFTSEDISNLIEVAETLYGSGNRAVISEIGIVSGVDKIVNSPSIGNTTIQFNELICAQIVSFINTVLVAPASSNGSFITFDLGATEPLLALV